MSVPKIFRKPKKTSRRTRKDRATLKAYLDGIIAQTSKGDCLWLAMDRCTRK